MEKCVEWNTTHGRVTTFVKNREILNKLIFEGKIFEQVLANDLLGNLVIATRFVYESQVSLEVMKADLRGNIFLTKH